MATEEQYSSAVKLSPATRIFLSHKYNCYIIAIIGFKTSIDAEIVKEGLKQTLIKHSRFSSKLVLKDESKSRNEPRWIPMPVNLEDHVIVPDLDQKIDDPDRFVEDYISHMTTSPLDLSKPLWELHLLNLRTSDSESVGVFRFHHTVGDGSSLMSLLLACTRQTSNPKALPTLPTATARRVDPAAAASSPRFLPAVSSALSLARNTFVDVLLFVATILFLRDTNTPIKGQKGVESTTKRFVHRSISLHDVKLIKDAMNTTINDVLLGVTTAGLSRYLNRIYGAQNGKDDKETKKMGNYLPKGIRLRARIAVNLRPAQGIQVPTETMAKEDSISKTKLGNVVGFLHLPFTISLQEDPLDYIRGAKSTVDRKKNSYGSLFTYLFNKLLLKTLGTKAAVAARYRDASSTTINFSNMAGPLEEINLFGHPLAYLAATGYGNPYALAIQFVSYFNKMTIALAVDPNVIPDPHQLLDDLEESFKLIKNAVLKQGESV
ncbi:O-acyltransferase [Trema orientale]|uniref:O-acyltransferase n=1 Tax=Trema orientale TaxID=63057 RepID=A0A2P5FTU3_TREOI|nr:O-acyltransferase [Trema orientale]